MFVSKLSVNFAERLTKQRPIYLFCLNIFWQLFLKKTKEKENLHFCVIKNVAICRFLEYFIAFLFFSSIFCLLGSRDEDKLSIRIKWISFKARNFLRGGDLFQLSGEGSGVVI